MSGIDQSRKGVHDGVQKVDLQSATCRCPNHVAIGEIVVRINDQQLWLHATVDLGADCLLHVRLFRTFSAGVASFIPRELEQEGGEDDAEFLVDDSPRYRAALRRHELRLGASQTEIGTPWNLYSERLNDGSDSFPISSAAPI